MSERVVRERLKAFIESAGSITNLAKHWKVSPALISLTASGARSPSPTLLRKMKLVREAKTTFTYRAQ